MKISLIGKNLTNLVLANVLANKKLHIDIFSSPNLYKNDSSRTLAISKDNYDYLKKIDKNLNIYTWPSKRIKIYVEKKSSELFEFKNEENKNFYLIKYNEIYNFFLKKLSKNNFINFAKPKNSFKEFSCNKYNLVINSDSKSFITKKYFHKKINKNYNSIAHTCIINHQKIKNNIAIQIFTKLGPLAFLPLSNNQTSIVLSYNGKKINIDQFKEIIKKFNINYKIKSYEKYESFYINFSMLRNYYHKNILSFGDLLHRVHPLAGQGFNMTIRDIKVLSKIIDEKIYLGLQLDNSVLEDFENKTKHLNYIYGSGIDFIYNFFKLDSKVNNLLSDPIFKILNRNNFLNKYANYFSDKGINI
tara:strand:- start:175 stop:1251 length:1077 start_codon:yes stop_codon:yes gene_type:complete